MSREGLMKQGFLYKLPVKGLVKKWTKRWFNLYTTTHEGVVRLEYFDSPESMVTNSGKRTIPLRECTEVTATIGNKVHPYAFQFTSLLGHHVLAAETQPEVESWIDNIKSAIHEDKIKRRRSKAQSRVVTTSGSDIEQSSEKGISYKNKVDSGTYRVIIEENETSKRMNLSGAYNLELGPTKLSLSASSGATIFTFPYKFLKNYGKQSGQFHFEAGKNSPIGEGRLVFVTTCSKEIFGVVHNNIKRLKNQADRKLSSEGGQRKLSSEGAPPKSEVPLRVKPPPPKSSQPSSSGRTSIGGRPSSRHSTEITAGSVPGTYRTSRNMEEKPTLRPGAKQTESATDPSAVYAVVDKSKKKSAMKKEEKPVPVAPQPYKKKASGPVSTQPASKTVRDSRLSTMLVEIDSNAFDDSFDEDDDDDDNNNADMGYDENLEPLTEGVRNPFDDDADIPGGEVPQENIKASSDPQAVEAVGETSNLLSIDHGQEQQKLGAPSASSGNKSAATEEPTKSNLDNVVENLDFGFGPGNLKPSEDETLTSANPGLRSNVQKPPTQNLLGDLDFGFSSATTQQAQATAATPGNPGNIQKKHTQNLLDDLDFSFVSANNQQVQATPSAANTVVMPDLNFDFGDLPPISGLGTAGNDPFSTTSQPPPTTGNIAELDFGSLDNFFDKIEAMNLNNQAPNTAGLGTAAFANSFDTWRDNTAL